MERCAGSGAAGRAQTGELRVHLGAAIEDPAGARHLEDAEGSIRRTLRIDPTNAHGWVGRASIRNRLLHPQDALASYRKAEFLDPHIPLLHGGQPRGYPRGSDVTARHRAEKLEDVPQNIDVLTSQDLQNSNIDRIVVSVIPMAAHRTPSFDVGFPGSAGLAPGR